MTKKQAMYSNMQKHGEQLNAIFKTGIEPVKLCKMLLRLENKAHNATTCLCNTNNLYYITNTFKGRHVDFKESTEEEQDKFFDGIRASLSKIIGKENIKHVFINFDPRGYALKIKSDFAKDLDIAKDWGGYGILAPDFNQ